MRHNEFNNSLSLFLPKAFPTPKFMRMDLAGIDISDTAIRFIEFGVKKNLRYVKSFGEKRLPANAISSGFINKPEEVIAVLKEIKEEISTPFVNVSLPEEKAYLFKMQIPNLEGVDLYEAVGFRIEENAPISTKDAIYDFAVLNENTRDSDHMDILVSVIPSKVSETYAHVVKASGLFPISFEISSQAVGRAVVPRNSEGSHIIVNFGETKTGLAIMSKGMVYFTSTISFGSSIFDDVMAEVFHLSSGEISDFKSEVISSGKQDMESFLKVMESATPLKDEIKKLFVYWKTHGSGFVHKEATIDSLILCGSDTAMPAIDEYFHASTGIKTEIADVWRNVFSFENYIPPISYREALNYGGAIGLAMNYNS